MRPDIEDPVISADDNRILCSVCNREIEDGTGSGFYCEFCGHDLMEDEYD